MSGTLPLTYQLANVNNRFNTSTYKFTVQTGDEGYYYIEVCAGIQAATPAVVGVQGGTSKIGFVWWSRINNNVDSGCRSAIVSLTAGDTLSLSLDVGAVYSDSNVQTSFSAFSLQDVLTPEAYGATIFAKTSQPASNSANILFNSTTVDTKQYNSTTGTYICPTSGVYFFSFSLGISSGQQVDVKLTGANLTVGLKTNMGISNTTTVARSALVGCQSGSSVSVTVTGGVPAYVYADGAGYSLNSFTAFSYAPRTVTPAVWAVYASNAPASSAAAVDPLPFDIVHINPNGLFDAANNTVTIQSSGYYYVYISSGEFGNAPGVLSLRKTSDQLTTTLFNVDHRATSYRGGVTLGHGAVVQLTAGDQLKVVGEANSSFYSNSLHYLLSFFGFLLVSA